MNKIRAFIKNNLRGIGAFLLPLLFVLFVWELSSLHTIGASTETTRLQLYRCCKESCWCDTSLLLYLIPIILYISLEVFFWRYKPVKRDRILFASSGKGMVWAAICFILFVLSIILAIANWFRIEDIYIDAPKKSHGVFWEVLSQFFDPGNIYHSEKGASAFVAFISAFTGIICISGLLVSSFVSSIAQKTQRWRKGLIHYSHGFENYIVVIGINEQTANIIHDALNEKSADYILIQTRKDVEKERAKLELKLEKWEEEKIVFYSGERTLYEDIRYLHLENAKEVYVLGEDMNYENEQDHDSYNITCFEHILEYTRTLNGKKYKKYWVGDKLKCHVELEYQSTFTAIKTTPMYKTLNNGRVEFFPFNVHEIWAQKVLVYNSAVYKKGKLNKVQKYLPLDDNITLSDSRTVHLVVIGMNQMGVALAMQAALVTHLPNFVRDKRLRTTITFIDNNAVQESEFLMGRFAELFELCRYRTIVSGKDYFDKRDFIGKDGDVVWKSRQDDSMRGWYDPMLDERSEYKHLGDNFMDIQWEFIEGNVASKDVQEYISALSSCEAKVCTIAVCFNNPQQSIATAVYFPRKIFDGARQILVYQKNSFDFISTISKGKEDGKKYEKLRPFGITEGCYHKNSFDEYKAMFVNFLYMQSEVSEANDIMQDAKRLWADLGMQYKLANINMADSMASKWRSLGKTRFEQMQALSIDTNRDSFAETEHNRWLTERLANGYRPLVSKEWSETINIIKNEDVNQFLSYKMNLKDHSKAHLDICPYQFLKDIDPPAWDRQNDLAIVNAMTIIELLTRQLTINDLFRDQHNKNSLSSIVQDMQPIEVLTESIIDIEDFQGEKLQSFSMCKNPITQRQWKLVMGQLPDGYQNDDSRDEKPMTNVSKEMAEEFIEVVKDKYKSLDFRLPLKEELMYVKNSKHSEIHDLKQDISQSTQACDSENNNSNLIGSFRLVFPFIFNIPNKKDV